MLTLNKIQKTAQANYYQGLTGSRYYDEGGESPGQWWTGGAASELGLNGEIKDKCFLSFLQGVHPQNGTDLVKNSASDERVLCWDATFSAPKSVSILALTSDELGKDIRACHRAAVAATLRYLNESVAVTRVGKGGRYQRFGDLVVACYEHKTSRAEDPQLHTHCLIGNLVRLPNGRWGALDSRLLYRHKMVAGMYYRLTLAQLINSRLGLQIKPTEDAFEIDGIPDSLIREFSKRREAIEAELEKLGLESAKAAEMVALKTRTKKSQRPLKELVLEWKEAMSKHSVDVHSLAKGVVANGDNRILASATEIKRAVESAVEQCTRLDATFRSRHVFVAAGAQLVGKIGPDLLLEKAARLLHRAKGVVALGRYKGEPIYTTKKVLELEKRLFSIADILSQAKSWALDPSTRNLDHLDSEKRDAVSKILEDPSALSILSGFAGTGKTTVIRAIKDAYIAAGINVYGLAPTGKAASGLSKATKISARTIALERVHSKIPWGPNTVISVDEAAMVDSNTLLWVLERAKASGTKVILVGDDAQLQPVAHGNAFTELADRFHATKLRKIERQSEPWAREVVRQLACGDARTAVSLLNKNGKIKVGINRVHSRIELVRRWGQGSPDEESNRLITAGTNKDVERLNSLAQTIRIKQRRVRTDKKVTVGTTQFFQGDRVVFCKNSYSLGVHNGDFGTIRHLSRTTIVVRMDDGRNIRFGSSEYPHLKLGYASTVHKSQGMTVDRSLTLFGGALQDREQTYVQLSRARKESVLFVGEEECGEGYSELVKTATRSRKKTFASRIRRGVRRRAA